MSALEPVHQEHVDDGIVVVSVLAETLDGDPSPEDAREWRDVLGISYAAWVDPSGRFAEEWNPDRRFPLAYVLDRAGEVVLTDRAGVAGVPELEEAALAAL